MVNDGIEVLEAQKGNFEHEMLPTPSESWALVSWMFFKGALALSSIHITFLRSLTLFPWQPFKSLQKGTAVLKRKGQWSAASSLSLEFTSIFPTTFLALGGSPDSRAGSPQKCSSG